ncbi:hypothetical protein JD969_20655 [Planctomycetota bacterium]|nr:hypothetical protein JD969_20655 [Planctomycetota bacterium]
MKSIKRIEKYQQQKQRLIDFLMKIEAGNATIDDLESDLQLSVKSLKSLKSSVISHSAHSIPLNPDDKKKPYLRQRMCAQRARLFLLDDRKYKPQKNVSFFGEVVQDLLGSLLVIILPFILSVPMGLAVQFVLEWLMGGFVTEGGFIDKAIWAISLAIIMGIPLVFWVFLHLAGGIFATAVVAIFVFWYLYSLVRVRIFKRDITYLIKKSFWPFESFEDFQSTKQRLANDLQLESIEDQVQQIKPVGIQ